MQAVASDLEHGSPSSALLQHREPPRRCRGHRALCRTLNSHSKPQEVFQNPLYLKNQGKMPLAEYLFDLRAPAKLESLPQKVRGMLAECRCALHFISHFSRVSCAARLTKAVHRYRGTAAPTLTDHCFRVNVLHTAEFTLMQGW